MLYIYPGRFQPFHNDHLRILEKFFKHDFGDRIILAIVRNYVDLESTNHTDKITNENFNPDRNPFSVEKTLSMVSLVANKLYSDNVLVTLIPRPSSETAWGIIENFFPEPRTWIIPKRGEEWDEMKANYFKNRGDNVLRIQCDRRTNGKYIRELLKRSDYEEIEKQVPLCVVRLIKKDKDKT